MTAKTFYIAGFTVATGAKFYIFSSDGKAGQACQCAPHLFTDHVKASLMAEQAVNAYPLHAVAFVIEATRVA